MRRRLVCRRVAVATPEACEMASTTAEVSASSTTMAAPTVLPNRRTRPKNERGQNQSRPERLAQQLHVPTLTANRGGLKRFYTIRRAGATFRCSPQQSRKLWAMELWASVLMLGGLLE